MIVREDGEYKYYTLNFEEESNIDALKTNTLFLSKSGDKYGYVNSNGELVVDYIYDDAREQNSYGYCAVKQNGVWGVLASDGTVIFWGYNPVDMTLEVIHRVKLSNEPISVVAVDLTCTRGLAMSGTQVFGFEFIGSECKALHTKYASECVNCRASTSKMSATCKSCQRFLCAKCAKRESGLVCKVCQERRVSPE